jgi:hypothetical protein
MKRTTKLISMLLVLVMMLSALTVLVGADDTNTETNPADLLPLNMKNLGWTVPTENGLFYNSNYVLDLDETDPANKSLYITCNDTWNGIVIVPEEKMLGVTKYTVSMDTFDVISAARLCFVLNSPDPTTSKGDWAGFNWSTNYEAALFDTEGEKTVPMNRGTLSGKITAEVDLEAGIVKAYLDDELVREFTTTHTVASRIVLCVRGLVANIDNIEVVHGTKDNLGDASKQIYFEDFEGFRGPLPMTAENLGWTEGVWGADFTNVECKVLYSDAMGVANKAVRIMDMKAEGDQTYIEFVPASKMAGVTNYTVTWTTLPGNIPADYDSETDAPYFWNSKYGMMVGVTGVNTGDWLMNYYNTAYRTQGFGYEPAEGMALPKHTAHGYDAEGNIVTDSAAAVTKLMTKYEPQTYVAKIDTVLRTITVTVNGGAEFVTEGTSDVAGAIGFRLERSDVLLDNVSVVNDLTGETIYEEDFETYIEPKKPTRPVVDYSGKTAGETIFFENFDAAETVEELYMMYDMKAMAGGSGFAEAVVAPTDAVKGTTCASITGNWAAVEAIPAAVFQTYDIYTIHMDIMFESNGDRFDLFYQTAAPNSTATCGFLELRRDPMETQNTTRVDGAQVGGTNKATDIMAGEVFHLVLEVNNEYAEAVLYINGDYVSTATDLPNYRSALYLCAQAAVGCVDNMMVTAGTYEDYLATQGGDESECTKCPEGCENCTGDENCTCDHSTDTSNSDTEPSAPPATEPPVTEPPVTEPPVTQPPVTQPPVTQAPTTQAPVTQAPATQAPATQAPADDAEKEGCKSSAAVSALVMLVAFGAAGVAMKRGKKD